MRKLILLLYLVSSVSVAEIHKEAQICSESGQICFFWWPKLPEVSGWHQDIQHSYHYKTNTQAPNGFSFANSEAVIYARAEYQEDVKEKQTFQEFVSFSQNQFINGAPSKLNVIKTGELNSKGKHIFVSYSFFPEGAGNWEQVSYAEDFDNDGNRYFLIFVLSSRSKMAFDQNITVYNEFISNYR